MMSAESSAGSIDRTDRRILQILQANGRISNLKLAEAVHLSPPAVHERVKRLKRERYILRFEAKLNPSRLGSGILMFVAVRLERNTPDVLRVFKATMQAHREVVECHMVVGGFDYLLKVRAPGMAQFHEFVTSTVLSLPGLSQAFSYAVMEELKCDTSLEV